MKNILKSSLSHTKYSKLSAALTEKYRNLLVQADPHLEKKSAFHLAHNWGNSASLLILDKYNTSVTKLYNRCRKEYWALAAKEDNRQYSIF